MFIKYPAKRLKKKKKKSRHYTVKNCSSRDGRRFLNSRCNPSRPLLLCRVVGRPVHFSISADSSQHRRRCYDRVAYERSRIREASIYKYCNYNRRLAGMHPAEIEFMAENEIVQIVPTFNHTSHIHLICGSYGPFRAGLPLNVPIWVAMNLRQKKTCRILAPDWMAVDKLQERLEEEKANKYGPPIYTGTGLFNLNLFYYSLDILHGCLVIIIWKLHKCY